ncbi:bacterio-opsin activator [Natronococcus sp. JC468]|uniref:helix-turn-helix domain-containing protein n=1 Tax=Natronococcus sp. JC468 TaxID=1961921 RepID=UPI00143A22C4|nr:helix-turn-helix domain-containing protein [Natronococcus sp. JC468]NKE37960.1 bacterio-opsin activator [Natronococcus sp. JC468]
MLLATIRLDPEALALAATLERLPSLEIEVEQIAAHATDWTMPCLWVADADFDDVDDALAADPSVEEIVETLEFNDEKYYLVDWTDEIDERIDAYVDHAGSVLTAAATAAGWQLRLRFAGRDQFDAFRETLVDRGYSFELLELSPITDRRYPISHLTSGQLEALRTARERGYYEVPREITMRELAAELDTSHQNLSKLLRRATKTLIDVSLYPTVAVDDR